MNPPCDLCGDTSLDPYVRGMYALAGSRFDLTRCRSCSLVQVRPLPPSDAIADLYDDDYFDKDYDSCLSADSYFDSFERLMHRYDALLDVIEGLGPKTGSLFEIGCAGGYFLKLARERGWQTRGIEITAVGARHAREELGLCVEQRAFPDLGSDIDAGPFDVVYMGHVLEHLPSPAAAIAVTTRLVAPQGLLVVEVPTYIDSFYFRGLLRLAPLLRAGRRLGGDAAGAGLLRALKFPAEGETMAPYHLYEFCRGTLRRLLERFGYTVLRAESRVPKPEGLAEASGLVDRAISAGFDVLDLGARAGLPGGNISMFARRDTQES